ncbi:MAG: hypothetical protein ABI575_10255, partial [Oxalobacteraceae bacterium]
MKKNDAPENMNMKAGPKTHLPAGNGSRLTRFAATLLISAIGLSGCGGGSGQDSAQAQSRSEVTLAQVQTSSSAAVLTDAVFAPTSFWYSAIPVDAPLHANSAGFVADFLRQKQAYYDTVNINTREYASPVFIAEANTPTTKVAYSNCQHKFFPETALEAQWAAVPIPSYAVTANGSDAEMTIYQPSTNTLWEFWKASNDDGQWRACWGGKMENVNASDGIWPHPYGATATGLPFLGGQITAEELRRGEIRHAIGISLVETEARTVFSWPANRSDGHNIGHAPNRIPQGLRFRPYLAAAM